MLVEQLASPAPNIFDVDAVVAKRLVLVELTVTLDVANRFVEVAFICTVLVEKKFVDDEFPNICPPVHVFACPRASEATTEPVVGEMVSVPSEFETDDTAPPPEIPSDEVATQLAIVPLLKNTSLAGHDDVPVPPFAKPTIPVRLMLGVEPPDELSGAEAFTAVTPPADVVVEITLPLESTANMLFVRFVSFTPLRVDVDVTVNPVVDAFPRDDWPLTMSEASVPTDVSDEVTTVEFRVVPVKVPAGATTVVVDIAVTKPFPFTVTDGTADALPYVPTFVLTVARVTGIVVVPEPVASPESVIV